MTEEKTFRFNGPMGSGYMRNRRAEKRQQAEERNAATKPERKRSARR